MTSSRDEFTRIDVVGGQKQSHLIKENQKFVHRQWESRPWIKCRSKVNL
jgi:hypothetical protein